MAVYTALNNQKIAAYLDGFKIGHLVAFSGVSGGIENTNYFVTAQVSGQTKRDYVLTLFEDLSTHNMPYFIALMEHLVNHGVATPSPLRDNSGVALRELAGKPALLLPRFCGNHLAHDAINAAHCAVIGRELAALHQAGLSFDWQRHSHRGHAWWTLLAPQACQHISSDEAELLMSSLCDFQAMQQSEAVLPMGVIHGDLFHDNALFSAGKLSAIIDIYNASHDYLLYDVAITVNDWCVKRHGEIDEDLCSALLQAYQQVRVFTKAEHQHWNTMLRTAAMRFWLSRLETYHGLHSHQRAEGPNVLKDPNTFRHILHLRTNQQHRLPDG